MADFSWNLGGDDATASDPHQTNPQPVVPVPVVPAPVLQVRPESVQPVSEKPLSRRELRHRAEAGAAEQVSARTSEPTEPSLIEFFQVHEPQVHEPQVVDVSTPVETPVRAPESRREARARRAEAAADTVAGTQALAPESVVSTDSHSLPKRASKGKPVRQRSSNAAPRGHSTGSRVRGKSGRRRALFSKLFSLSAMIGVGALMVSTSLPANAFYNAADAVGGSAGSSTSHAQSLKVASTAVETAATRDGYTVSSLAAQLLLKYGNRNYSYTNDINGTIQWPFPIPVPISSGFGPRIAPCGGCSSVHQGVDFTPGSGVAIDSIADGVVSEVVASHAGLGNHVVVDHVINGQKVQSVYGHMLDNSFAVTVGQEVKVAQTLGLVGSTGESTGAHLHLEIHINGVPVDPFAWLKANAN